MHRRISSLYIVLMLTLIVTSMYACASGQAFSSSPATSSAPAPAQAASQTAASQTVDVALPKTADSVKFAVIGDTGTGGSDQYRIAKLLNNARANFPYEFVIMLGDNLYTGNSQRDYERGF